MPLTPANVRPEDWIYKAYARVAVDTNVLLRIRYKGSQLAAHVSLATTTGDMTYEQGATTAAAAVGTGDNPGTSGVIDISGLTYLYELLNMINATDDWEAWPVDYPPDHAIEVSAGNAIFFGNLADQDCTGENGFAVLVDTSLMTAENFPVGVTWNGPSTNPHGSDSNVLHEVLQIVADVTFGGATGGIDVILCDDVLQTSEVLTNLPLVTATATTFGTGDTPLFSNAEKGGRLVFKAKDASGAITPATITVYARSYAYGPAFRKSKMWSAKN